jgi:GNAT superfamily N-acetyltransferase
MGNRRGCKQREADFPPEMENLSIDRARPTDQDAVVALLAAQMAEHRVRSETEKLLQLFHRILADERSGFVLVARLHSEIVAVVYVATILSVEHGGRSGWLEELYVTPRQRKRGIGSALLNSVIKLACELGLVALDLEVDADHQPAESLYARFGFRRLPRSRWVRESFLRDCS